MPNDRSILGLQIEAQTVGEQSIDKLTNSYNKFAEALAKQGDRIVKQNDSAGASFSRFKAAIENPLATAQKSIESFVEGYGKVGLVVGGTITAIAAGTAYVTKFAAEQASLAEQNSNLADRLGLTSGETERLSAMAKAAGVDIGFMSNATAKLSVALEDQGDAGTKARAALAQLGVATRTSAGGQRELGQITLDTIQNLGRMQDGTARLALATTLFGKSANELTPLIRQYRDLDAAVRKFGVGVDETATNTLLEFDNAIDNLGTSWDQFKKSFAATVSPVIKPVIDFTTAALNVGSPGTRNNDRGIGGPATAAKVAADQARIDAANKEQAEKDRKETERQNKLTEDRNKQLERQKQIVKDIVDLQQKANADAAARALGPDAVPALQSLVRELSKSGLTGADKLTIANAFSPEIAAQQAEAQKKAQAVTDKLTNSFLSQGIISQQQGIGFDTAQRIANIGGGSRSGEEVETQRIIAQIRTDAAQRVFALEQQRIALEHAGDDDKTQFLNEQIDVVKARAALTKEIQDAEADRDQKILAIEKERTDLAKQRSREFDVAKFVDQQGRNQSDADRQVRFVQASTRPGQEVSSALRVEQIRLDAAQKIADLEVQRLDAATRDMDGEEQESARSIENLRIVSDLEKSRQDASLEYWDSVLTLQQRQIEQGRDAAGKVFDAITASGKDGFSQLAISFGKTIERQIFVNLTSVAFDRSRKSLSNIIPGQTDANGNLTTTGKILQGTPFGVDPLKIATTLNTRSHDLNTAALDRLNTTFGKISGGASRIDIPTLLDRPMLRTPGTFQDGLKDDGKNGEPTLKRVLEDTAETQKQGQEIVRKLADKVLSVGTTVVVSAAQAAGGFGQGGAKGIVAGTAGIASAAGSILHEFSGALGKYGGMIGSIAGVGLSLISSFLPNAKQQFDQAQDAALAKNKYTAPTSNSTDFDVATGGTTVVDTARGLPQVIVNISAVDAAGVKRLFETHGTTLADIVGDATRAGMSPSMTQAARQAVIGPEA